ncbi:hypothetical protein GQ42DRAFT_1226 [Ramicandelaber brevisporus]|nr:hypothetical protein GQ42DRAFT_1226 [Ramicandelaber brevisporus]
MAGGGGLAMHLSDSARMPMTTYTAATAIQRQLEDAKRIIDPMSPEIAVLLSEVVFSAAVQGTNVRQSITKLSALAEDFTTWHPQRAVGYIAAARAAWLRALNAGYPGDDNHGKDDAAIAPAVEQAMNAAITLASRALQLEPGSSDALVLRGRLKLDLARITITAEEDRLGPSHPDLDTVLQAVRTELIPAALRDLEAAFKLDHSIVNAAELMGGLCAAGQINRAILMAEELDVTVDDPSECVLVVVAHASIIAADLLQQQSQPNIQQQQQQQQADIPLNPRSKRLLASALAKLRTAAQKITSSTSSVNPIAISVLIADALLKLGRHQESLSVLEQAGVATNPIATIARVQSVVHGRIGIISDALGEEIKAIMALTAAVECDPRNTAAKEALEEIVAEQAAQQG